jgi:hypothetical protein
MWSNMCLRHHQAGTRVVQEMDGTDTIKKLREQGRSGFDPDLVFIPFHPLPMATNNSPPPPFLEALTANKQRKPRKQSEFTKQERGIMGRNKEAFKTTSGKERDNVLRGKILVDIFNFWHSKGIHLGEDEMEKRVTV